MESLEKVIRLIGLLNGIFRDPELRGRLVLRGGTALNRFLFAVPRLSVDIDLNYIGSVDREGMAAERPGLEARLQAIFETDSFTVRRMPEEHAGGKWQLRYQGAQGLGGNLEVDLNFLHRVPIEPIRIMDSTPLGSFQVKGIPVLDPTISRPGSSLGLRSLCSTSWTTSATGNSKSWPPPHAEGIDRPSHVGVHHHEVMARPTPGKQGSLELED